MKKTILLFCGSVVLLLLLSFASAQGYQGDDVFRLPASLRVIEESAFEGTGASKVVLMGEVERIESRAFARMPRLEAAFIPPSTRAIAADAFEGSRRPVVFGRPGSYAHRWALRQGYLFMPCDLWHSPYDGAGTEHLLCLYPLPDGNDSEDHLIAKKANGPPGDELMTSPKDKPEMRTLDYDFP